jgi:hypothetical protein
VVERCTLSYLTNLQEEEYASDYRAGLHNRLFEIASERTFTEEMATRLYDTWAVRRASVVQTWSGSCVFPHPHSHHAMIVADALRRAVPRLVVDYVYPDSD